MAPPGQTKISILSLLGGQTGTSEAECFIKKGTRPKVSRPRSDTFPHLNTGEASKENLPAWL